MDSVAKQNRQHTLTKIVSEFSEKLIEKLESYKIQENASDKIHERSVFGKFENQ